MSELSGGALRRGRLSSEPARLSPGIFSPLIVYPKPWMRLKLHCQSLAADSRISPSSMPICKLCRRLPRNFAAVEIASYDGTSSTFIGSLRWAGQYEVSADVTPYRMGLK